MRLTAACPEAFIESARHLAMVLAEGPADSSTYRDPNWRDSGGNAYAVASFEVAEPWLLAALGPLQRPTWDSDAEIDLDKAREAQVNSVIWTIQDETAPPHADPSRLTLIAGIRSAVALQALGLTIDEASLDGV